MIDLLKIWLGLECIGINGQNLHRIDGHTCDDIELVLIANFESEEKLFYRYDLPLSVREKVSLTKKATRVNDIKTLVNAAEIRYETTYNFPNRLPNKYPDVIFLGDTKDTLDTMAIIVDGEIVSRAWSVRRNDQSAEIAVETKEAHRRKGYGGQVVKSWVNYQLDNGKEAIYSHRSGNLESKALAESVNANKFVDVISFMER